MTSLAAIIQSLGLSGTAAEIRTALNADVELSRNSTPQSLAGVADRLAAQGLDVSILIGLRNHIRTLPVGGDTMEGLLLTGGGTAGGVDFTLPTVRGQIAYNQGHPATTAEQQAILAGLLLIGITPGKQWQKSGLESLPSEAEITAALAQLAFAEWAESAIQTLRAGINGEQTDIAAYKQMIAET